MKLALLRLIEAYQKYISFDRGLLGKLLGHPGVCRFTPSCSQYTHESIKRYGIINGLYLGLKRIVRCHPGSKGGFDPVPS